MYKYPSWFLVPNSGGRRELEYEGRTRRVTQGGAMGGAAVAE